MKEPVFSLGLATLTIAAVVIPRQQQSHLDIVRGHVEALAAVLVVGFFAACIPAKRCRWWPR